MILEYMPTIQELSAHLPDYAQTAITASETSTYQKHMALKDKYLQDASFTHPYGVFDPTFITNSAAMLVCGISAATQINAKYPNGLRTDILIEFDKDIVGYVYTGTTSASCQYGDILRIRDRAHHIPHRYPSNVNAIKSYEILNILWSKDS